MNEVIYSSIMTHVEKIIDYQEISDLHKLVYTNYPFPKDQDEFDVLFIDKLIRRFDFNRLTSRREISLTQLVSAFFPSAQHLEYAFVLKRLLNISTFVSRRKVGIEGDYQVYSIEDFKKHVTDGLQLDVNVIQHMYLITGLEFRLTENDVILTLCINMDVIDNLEEFLFTYLSLLIIFESASKISLLWYNY